MRAGRGVARPAPHAEPPVLPAGRSAPPRPAPERRSPVRGRERPAPVPPGSWARRMARPAGPRSGLG